MWVTTLARITFIAGLFLPAIVAPVMIFSNTLPRALWLLGVGVCALVVLLYKKRTFFEFGKIELLLFLYGGLFVFSSIIGVDPAQSFWSDGGRAFGAAHLVAWILWFLVAREEIKIPATQRWFWWIICVQGLVIGIFSVLKPFFFYCDDMVRLCGSFGNPMVFAAYIAPLILILLASWRPSINLHMPTWYRTVVMPGTVVLLAWILYNTLTRAALLGLFCGFVVAGCVWLFYAYHGLTNKKVKRLICGIVIFTGLTSCLLFGYSESRTYIINTLAFGRGVSTLQTRFLNWHIALRGAREHIVFGRGPENYRAIADKYFDPALLDYSYYETRIDKPHNAQLELLVGAGIVGLSAYLIFIFVLFLFFIRRAVGAYGVWGAGALAGALVALQVTLLFSFETHASITILSYLMMCAAMVSVSDAKVKKIKIIENNVVRAVAIVCAIGVWIYGGVLPARAAYYTQSALNHEDAGNTIETLESVARAYALPVGPYDFEIWQWTSGALMTRYTSDTNLGKKMPESLKREWRTAVVTNGLRTEKYLAEHVTDARWQLFGGKAAYHAAVLLDDPRYLAIAEKAFHQAQILSPNRQESWDVLVYVNMLQAHYEEAVANTVRAVRIRDTVEMETTIDALVDRLQKEKRIDLITNLFEQLIEVRPTAERYARLAAAYAALQKYALAREAVAHAVELDATYAQEAELFLKQLPK